MKATFFKNIKTLSGKDVPGNMVFGAYKNKEICIVRNYVKPRLTEQNELKGLKMKAAAGLWKSISVNFMRDLGRYANAFNSQHLVPPKLPLSAFNVFFMAVLKHPTPIASILDLVTVMGENLDQWVTSGNLRKVSVSQPFTATVQ